VAIDYFEVFGYDAADDLLDGIVEEVLEVNCSFAAGAEFVAVFPCVVGANWEVWDGFFVHGVGCGCHGC
jgi:hypothetical protein